MAKKSRSVYKVRRSSFAAFLFLALGIGGSLLLTLCGWQNFYNDRRLLGSALISFGCLCGLVGLSIWWLNAFPATWGWLL